MFSTLSILRLASYRHHCRQIHRAKQQEKLVSEQRYLTRCICMRLQHTIQPYTITCNEVLIIPADRIRLLGPFYLRTVFDCLPSLTEGGFGTSKLGEGPWPCFCLLQSPACFRSTSLLYIILRCRSNTMALLLGSYAYMPAVQVAVKTLVACLASVLLEITLRMDATSQCE